MAAPPPIVDFRSRLPQVRDQADRPTCVAFAVSVGHEDVRFRENGRTEDLSEDGLYWGCKKIDGNASAGTSFESAAEALEQWGQPLETVWPYNAAFNGSGAPSPPAGVSPSDGWFRRRMGSGGSGLDQVRSSLAAGSIVMVGLVLTDRFFAPASGWIASPAATDRLFGGHAVAAVGYNETASTPHLILRNSWGTGWGDGGYGYLPYNYFHTYVLACWIMAGSIH